ncbi:MAG: DinB family protein [Candidatus Sulfotelmatobacter sp.]
MELLDHLRRQFAYEVWGNGEVLSAIKASRSESASGKPLQLMAHILSVQRLWLERLTQQSQSQPVWPEYSLDQCRTHMAELRRLWSEYLAQLSSVSLVEKITYRNSKGEPWSSTVQDVLTHVLLHSAYHRGQIASLMRAGGDSPAYTDFIHAVRQGFVE